MSITVGSGTRFSSNARATPVGGDQPFQARGHAEAINRPPPPAAYQGLQVGPEMRLEYEAPQAQPVSGSNGLLRNLSPFVIQVELPLAFANDPTVLAGGSEQAKQRAVGIYEAANRGRSAIQGRGALANAEYMGSLYQGGNASYQEVIVKGMPDPQVNQSGDGAQLVAKDGETPLGKLGSPSIADLNTALDIALQLSVIANTPPLVLLVNPTSLNMRWTKIQNFSDRTRFGYVFQAWGEEQPRLSITAKSGAFYSRGRGVQMASRRDSAAWQNLMSLFAFYKNNGYIHDTVGRSNAHHFVGGLSIHYDGWIYYGNMESLSYAHEETNQLGGVVFSMEFVVSMMVDSSKSSQTVLPMRSPMVSPHDPRYYNTPTRPTSNKVSARIPNPFGDDEENSGRVYGQGASEEIRPSTGDPDFQEGARPTRTGTTSLPTSRTGFLLAASSEKSPLSLSSRPRPFGV